MKVNQLQEDKYIYTDGVDYSKTSDQSVWGAEEKVTSQIIANTKISGKWLNLCAGDGRFNNQLLEKVDQLIAADIDENALQKLIRITPKELRKKLSTKILNITEHFPFDDQAFDGVFCVGTLHLFPKEIFKKIYIEIDRVLKTGGKILIDFATDIKRVYPDGSFWVVDNEPSYSLEEATHFLSELFKDYEIDMVDDVSEPEAVTLNDKTYMFSSNFIVLKAIKR